MNRLELFILAMMISAAVLWFLTIWSGRAVDPDEPCPICKVPLSNSTVERLHALTFADLQQAARSDSWRIHPRYLS